MLSQLRSSWTRFRYHPCHVDSILFSVKPNNSEVSQAYNYVFDSPFNTVPSLAIGIYLLIQLCKTSHSTTMQHNHSQSIPSNSQHPQSPSSLISPHPFGLNLESIFGLLPTLKFNSATLKSIIFRLAEDPLPPSQLFQKPLVQMTAQSSESISTAMISAPT